MDLEQPFLIMKLPSDDIAKKVGGRGILSKMVVELWGQGETYEEVFTCVSVCILYFLSLYLPSFQLLQQIEVFPEELKTPWFKVVCVNTTQGTKIMFSNFCFELINI